MKKIYFIISLAICCISILLNVNAQTVTSNKIIIDAGHGGKDGGASYNGIVEADLNLQIALKLKTVFIEHGYEVDMTREDNNDLCDNGFVKKEDMNKRIKKINSGNYLCCISIHQNTFSDTKYKGAQTFYSGINSLSEGLATNVQNSIKAYLNNTTRDVVKRNNIYLLNKVSIPAIIVECGFITNPEEAKLLTNYEYQKQMAYCIYVGSEKWIKSLE